MVQVKSQKQPIVAKVAAKWAEKYSGSTFEWLELADRLEERMIDWARPLLQPYRYKCLLGGRGSGKSVAAADGLLITGLRRKIRVLCAREFQNSIKESVHSLLKERIEALGLSDFYQANETAIAGKNDSSFIFKGIRHNVQSVKSMQGITHCWIEEAQTISDESWKILVPTIREEGSEIWVTFNPLHETDVVYRELVTNKRSNSYVERVNWDRNPYFPEVLNEERLAMLASDPGAYHHIWEGGFWEQSDAQIFNGKWVVEEFEPVTEDPNDRFVQRAAGDTSLYQSPKWNGPYFGADFGFAQDPTTLVKVWEYDRKLWIEAESYAVGLDIDRTAERWLQDIPECDRYVIRADSARPESISYLRRHGIPRIVGVKKGKGSVEDGIAFMRSYDKIVIHPRCQHAIEEMRMYSYKVDRLSGDILPVIVDAWNHVADGIRYSLEPLILARGAAKRSGLKIY